MTLNLDPASVQQFLMGKKVYITCLVGMIVVAANHFGMMPYETNLNPHDWMTDEYKLIIGMFFRAGIAKAGSNGAAIQYQRSGG